MENLSLFNAEETAQERLTFPQGSRLDVVKLQFDQAETLSWQELFSGFDTLYAITYSSGINFVSQLLELFDKAEIIFGCEEVMSYSLQEIMAYRY